MIFVAVYNCYFTTMPRYNMLLLLDCYLLFHSYELHGHIDVHFQINEGFREGYVGSDTPQQ